MEVSITAVSGFSIMPTASSAAASGRHRKAMSASFSAALRAAGSLRTASSSVISAMSSRASSRSRMRSPVVPALPSINTFMRFASPYSKYASIIRAYTANFKLKMYTYALT